MARRSGNLNHPKKGSAIIVNPIRSIKYIEVIKVKFKIATAQLLSFRHQYLH
jgi:hypothetical protein